MKTSLSLANIKKTDRSDMLSLLLDFPAQCRDALGIALSIRILFARRDFTKIAFAGLGGSAIGADLVRSYLYFESKLPISVLREYELPAYVDSSTLVFISSYSGNTEETLSAYNDARAKGSTIIALSSGGALKEYAQRDKVTFIEIPRGLPPRCALGYMSIIPLCALGRLGLIKDPGVAVTRMADTLEGLKGNILNPNAGQKENIAKRIAIKLTGKFAVIYAGSVHFDMVATRFKGQLNENSKSLASSHTFPEMNHNEIMGWDHPGKLFKDFLVIFLRDKMMHPRVSARMDITRDILKKQKVKVVEIWSCAEDLLSRIFSLIYIGDFISFYLAVLYGIDPTPVERVTYLKNELAKRK
ncbi:MAG: bifunctional phosphoglucose/phosphomannose isomerase [Candidatus Omnitrophota bacterium]